MNESPTLLSALVDLYNHNDKSQKAEFVVSFKNVTRICCVAKQWSSEQGQWLYSICEKTSNVALSLANSPAPEYFSEKEIVGALARISGIPLHYGCFIGSVSDVIITSAN